MTNADHAGGILTVDLDAIVANWRTLKDRVAPAEVAAVVKADAYGLGVGPVARALLAAGCKTFFVSGVDEARELRQIVDATVFVLNPRAETDLAGAIPVLNSLDELRAWPRTRPAALKVDTGMARRGLTAADLAARGTDALLRGLNLVLVMSHLACAETPDHPLNETQRAAFAAARGRFADVPASLANSSGAFLPAAYHFDLVRAGAALYGVNPTPGRANPMRPAVQLLARIVQVRDVDAGATVGYGATHRFARPSRVATVAVGYADGYPRSLSNRGHGFVDEVRVPLVGRVSMDLASFDVTDVAASQLPREGFIELIGPHVPVDTVADAAGTIGYEILTALGRRYHRRFAGANG
jgi:alanine racemase